MSFQIGHVFIVRKTNLQKLSVFWGVRTRILVSRTKLMNWWNKSEVKISWLFFINDFVNDCGKSLSRKLVFKVIALHKKYDILFGYFFQSEWFATKQYILSQRATWHGEIFLLVIYNSSLVMHVQPFICWDNGLYFNSSSYSIRPTFWIGHKI